MRPSTLALAFAYCIKEQNISYTKFELRNTGQAQPYKPIPNHNFTKPVQLNQGQFNMNPVLQFHSTRTGFNDHTIISISTGLTIILIAISVPDQILNSDHTTILHLNQNRWT